MKRIIVFLLVSVFMLTSCSDDHKKEYISVDNNDNNKNFSEFADDVYLSEIGNNAFYYYMYSSDYEKSPESFNSFYPMFSSSFFDDISERYEKYRKGLEEFDYEELSPQDRITYDELKRRCDNILDNKKYSMKAQPLSPISGIHIQLPVLLSRIPLETDNEIAIYFEALKNIPEYFESIIEFEKNGGEKIIPLSKSVIDKICEQCSQMLFDELEKYLIDNFKNNIEKRNDREQLIKNNKKYVNEYVIPAYQELLDYLKNEKDILSENVNDPIKGYYEYLLDSQYGIDISINEIENEIINNQEMYHSIIDKYSEKYSYEYNRLERGGSILSNSEQGIKFLINKMSDEFYLLPDNIEYELKEIPKELQSLLPEAYYISSAKDAGTVFSDNKTVNALKMSTLAHEAFPGHLYQKNYTKLKSKSDLREYLAYDGFTEGWGIYSEIYGFEYYTTDVNYCSFLKSMDLLQLSTYAYADLKVNNDNWSVDDIKEYLSLWGKEDSESAETLYDYTKGEPGYYLSYYIGFCEINNIARELSEKGIELKEIHDSLLSVGPVHFQTLKKVLLEAA